MGLPCEDFHFSTAAPPFESIYQAICEVAGTDVPVTTHHSPTSPPPPNSSPKASSRCFRGDSLRLYDHKGDLELHVSLDGQNVFVIGNAATLLQPSCAAIARLGGTPISIENRPRPRIPWWQWPLYFLLLPVGLLAALLIILLWIAAIIWHIRDQRRQRRKEKTIRSDLVSIGRYMPWSEVESKLTSGQGTLIIEHLDHNASIREWWTGDDLVGESPIPLPMSPILSPEGDQRTSVRRYANSCAARYTDPVMGIAKLTQVPAPELRGSRRKLSERYPRARIVVLFVFDWDSSQSLIFGG